VLFLPLYFFASLSWEKKYLFTYEPWLFILMYKRWCMEKFPYFLIASAFYFQGSGHAFCDVIFYKDSMKEGYE